MSSIRVLVADDNALSLRFFAEAFAALDVACVAVEDGILACESAAAEAFDAVLLDARMPRLDGIGALRRLRASTGPSRHAVALATTAAHDDETHAALRMAGFADVLVKPLSTDELRAALGRHIPLGNAIRRHDENRDESPTLDDDQALAAAGGDAPIVAALRGLFASELEALPTEIAAIDAKKNRDALRERLHRIDASAGFCGAPTIVRASAALRGALACATWPHGAVEALLSECQRVRELLTR